jgi:hypothetical protein
MHTSDYDVVTMPISGPEAALADDRARRRFFGEE